jgi:hypothetical protein
MQNCGMHVYPPRPPRIECVRPAFVNTGEGMFMTCLIRNISARGACISPLNQYPPSDEFELEDKFTLERWTARVVWRSVDRMGLRLFGDTPRVYLNRSRSIGRK